MTPTFARTTRVSSILNLFMGAWLFVSAFLWPHTAAARNNALAIGAVIMIFAAASMWRSSLFWVDALPALWLFGTALWVDHGNGITPWNSAFVAAVVFFSSTAGIAAPDEQPPIRRTPGPRHA